MTEANALKQGDTVDYRVGDNVLILAPIPYGQLKKINKIVFGAINQIGNLEPKEVIIKLPELFEENLGELITLMFKKKKHPFLTPEWIDENLTLVDIREIVEKAIVINGLKDFLEKMGVGEIKPATPVSLETGTAGTLDKTP